MESSEKICAALAQYHRKNSTIEQDVDSLHTLNAVTFCNPREKQCIKQDILR